MSTWSAPYAVSAARGGGIVHRAVGVGPYFAGSPKVGLNLWCGATISLDATPVDEPRADDALCARCDVPGIQVAPCVVYLARVEAPRAASAIGGGPYLKVGHTTRLAARLLDLPGELIEQIPGGSREEHSLMAAVSKVSGPKRGREWFADSPAVRSAALGWFADRLDGALPMSAAAEDFTGSAA